MSDLYDAPFANGRDDGRVRRRRWGAALIAILVSLALVGSLIPIVRGGDDGDVTTDDLQDVLPPPGPPASQEEVRQAVDEIIPVVEAERGLEFKQPVTVELASDEEFERRLFEDFEEDAATLRDDQVLFTAFGLIDPDVDVIDALQDLLGAGVVGFYDPETDELVVRGTQLTPFARTTIAHELVHALDDQHFDLDRPAYDDAEDEIGFGFTALVEGNARRIDNAFVAGLSAEERETALAEQFALGADTDLSGIPPVLIDMIDAPYSRGSPFVEALLAEGGQDSLDAAFAAPPTTSEQIIEPDKFIAGETRVEVPPPSVSDGAEKVDEGVVGQLLIELVLADDVPEDEASRAAEGWGGDWAVTWREGDRSCAALAVVGDTPDDTAELADAFGQWADAQDDASVSPSVPGQPVTVQACAG